MHGERKFLRIHVRDQVRHADGRLNRRVQQVAPQPNRVGIIAVASLADFVVRSCVDQAKRHRGPIATAMTGKKPLRLARSTSTLGRICIKIPDPFGSR